MQTGHVVYFSTSGATLWSWQGRGFAPAFPGSAPMTNPMQLVAELVRLPVAPVAILVDRIDEEHLRETIPRLGRRDQQALLARRLARAFARSPYRVATLQGRSLRNPEENHALLSALTRPDPVRELLGALASARVPVTGVFIPALLSDRLLDDTARSADAVLLVLHRGSGSRQHSFFRRGELIGSRGLRGLADPALEDGAFLQRQVEESLRYFDATYEATVESPLQLLLSTIDRRLLTAATGHGETWQLHELQAEAINRRLQLPAGLQMEHSERCFIEMLRNTPLQGNLAPAGERRYFRIYRARGMAGAVCLAVAGLALAGAMRSGLDILSAGQQLYSSSVAVTQLQTVLPDPGTTAAGMDPLRMREVVMAYDAIADHQADPDWLLAAVAAAVTSQPGIQIDAIQWTVGSPDAEPAGAGGEAIDASAMAVPASATAADAVSVTVRGHVAPFRGDYVQAFAEIEAFADELRANPDVERVTPKAQPLDLRPDSTLTGEASGGNASGISAGFTLDIRLRLPGATA